MGERETDTRRYRVGDLIDIRPTDPFVTGWEGAVTEAKRQYDAQRDDTPIGIWLVDGEGEHQGDVSLDGIYYVGWVFMP